MGLRLRMPSFKLRVDGAEGREAHLENDDLRPKRTGTFALHPESYSYADKAVHGGSGRLPFSGSVLLVRQPNGLEPILS
jgi:hypothetical protein